MDGSSFFNSTASHVRRNVGGNKTRTHDCCHDETSSAKGLQYGAAVQEGKSVRNTKLTAEERRKEGEK